MLGLKFGRVKKILDDLSNYVNSSIETLQNSVNSSIATLQNSVNDSINSINSKFTLGYNISLGTNGFIILPTFLGGLIIQWGEINVSNNTGTVNFPFTYPNNVFTISSSIKFASTSVMSYNNTAGVKKNNTSSFSYDNGDSGNTATISWISIGY